MNIIEVQAETESGEVPDETQLQSWVDAALQDYPEDTEIVIRIVDEDESSQLNAFYRGKQSPTNILSFPFDAPEQVETNLLGDLVVCAPVLAKEAHDQHKPLAHHWAHIVIHGVLHLLGYDHIEPDEAEIMEAKEIEILAKLHIDNPYNEADEV
ncbi:MAG: rRNA maturation RNase YbeY [Methylomicrobium sp.]